MSDWLKSLLGPAADPLAAGQKQGQAVQAHILRTMENASQQAKEANRVMESGTPEEQTALGESVAGMFNPGGMFIGKGSTLWNPQKAEDFLAMGKSGAPLAARWKKTGTAQFPDGKLRQEIPDDKAALNWNPASDTPEPLLAGMRHPYLERSYPQRLEDVWLNSEKGSGGSWNEPVVGVGKDSKLYPGGSRSVVLHELQHAIQDWEGFAKGGSPSEFLKKNTELFQGGGLKPGDPRLQDLARRASDNDYLRLAGEAEARLTQARQNMSNAERSAVPPWKMWDVPAIEQMVRGVKTDAQLENMRRMAEILRSKQ